METTSKSVLLLGATGLVGSECLKLLANDASFNRVIVLTRGLLPHAPTERIEYHQIDFDVPATFQTYLGVDVVICALGTTIKKAGSQAAFRKVDYSYPLLFAERALKAGAAHFLLVSSSGANADSRIFYTRVKGELEIELKKLGYRSLSIFRPSLLLGHRTEFRLAEIISKALLSPINSLFPRSVRPIHVRQVAASILKAAKADLAGIRIVRNQDMLLDK